MLNSAEIESVLKELNALRKRRGLKISIPGTAPAMAGLIIGWCSVSYLFLPTLHAENLLDCIVYGVIMFISWALIGFGLLKEVLSAPTALQIYTPYAILSATLYLLGYVSWESPIPGMKIFGYIFQVPWNNYMEIFKNLIAILLLSTIWTSMTWGTALVLSVIVPALGALLKIPRLINYQMLALPFSTIVIVVLTRDSWGFAQSLDIFRAFLFVVAVYLIPYTLSMVIRRDVIRSWLAGKIKNLKKMNSKELCDEVCSVIKPKRRDKFRDDLFEMMKNVHTNERDKVMGRLRFRNITARYYIAFITHPFSLFLVILAGFAALLLIFPEQIIASWSGVTVFENLWLIRLKEAMILAGIGCTGVLFSVFASRENLDKWIDESIGNRTEVDCAIEALNQIIMNLKESKPSGQ